MRIFLSLALFLFQIIILSGCQKGAPENKIQIVDVSSGVNYEELQEKAEKFVPAIGKKGGQIVLSSFSDPKSFNPITSTENTTSEFTEFLFEGLVRANGVTLLPEPNLADTWQVSDDGLEWTFHIRPGVLWSDSVPFSAYDVEFTFNDLIFNPAINPNSARDIFLVDGKRIRVKAIDSSNVKFTLPFPYAPFLRTMSQQILPKHKFYQVVKSGKFNTALSIQTPPSSIVGTGPFLLDSYISSQKVVFKRNPLYWRTDSAGNRLPYLDRVVYTIVADQNAELLQFKRGEVDYLAAKGEDFPSLKKDEKSGSYTVYRLGPATGSNFLFFNQILDKDPATGKQYVDKVKLSWFTNVNFRKAVAHALDKQNMIRIVMNGLGYPQWSPMTPSEGYFFSDKTTQYPYDLKKAKEILAMEGFSDKNGDGYLEDKDGNTVEFSFVTNSGNVVRARISEIIRKDLEALGMKIHYQQLEFNSLIQKISNPPYEWDAILLGLTGGVEPHFGRNVWHSSGTLHMWYPRQKKPATEWERRVDSLFDVGVKELDVSKRKVIYDEWQQIISDQLPLIYTVLPERIYCISNKFKNLNPSLNGGLLHNLEYIYIGD
ncbi:MAG TPA: ABC transporter substrate-binding protein [Chitinispirillaceae bacterium]|nr:ABC transporter substrate-binding protein [Chitinispirillaceae bacterium]